MNLIFTFAHLHFFHWFLRFKVLKKGRAVTRSFFIWYITYQNQNINNKFVI